MLQCKIKKSGFGLIEVILATTIIIIILAALVFLSQTVISNQDYALQRTQALNIAQEIIEKVRQGRDTNYIDANAKGTTWNSFVDGTPRSAPEGDKVYSLKKLTGVNYSTFALANANATSFVAGSEPVAGHLDKYPAGVFNNIQYYATVQFDSTSFFNPAVSADTDDTVSYRVVCTVYWDSKGGQTNIGALKSLKVAELITDFRPRY